jgi:hypothetical protein
MASGNVNTGPGYAKSPKDALRTVVFPFARSQSREFPSRRGSDAALGDLPVQRVGKSPNAPEYLDGWGFDVAPADVAPPHSRPERRGDPLPLPGHGTRAPDAGRRLDLSRPPALGA